MASIINRERFFVCALILVVVYKIFRRLLGMVGIFLCFFMIYMFCRFLLLRSCDGFGRIA